MLANCWAAPKAERTAGATEWSSAAKKEKRKAETSALVSVEHSAARTAVMTAGELAQIQVAQRAAHWDFQTAALMDALTADLLASLRGVTLAMRSVVSREEPSVAVLVAQTAEPMVDPTARQTAASTVVW